MAVSSVLLIEPDPQAAAYIGRALTRAGFQVLHSPTGKEGLISAWRDQPDAIVLEMDLPDIDPLEVLRKLRRDGRTAHKPMIALTARSEPALMAAAREAGVNEYLLKQADTLPLLLRGLAGEAPGAAAEARTPGAPPAAITGQVLVFLSANGGSGTSSMCLNAAAELARLRPPRSVVVVDLVLPIGSLAPITGAKPTPDLLHLAQLPPAARSPESMRRALTAPPGWGFQLVPGTTDPGQGAGLPGDLVGPLLQTLRAAYPLVLIDIGRNLSDFSLMVLGQADLAAVVFSAEPTPVANTATLLRFLLAEGIPAQRLFTLANRPAASQGLGGEQVEHDLGRPIDGGVPHTGPHLALANSQHMPYSDRFPDDTAALAFRELALRIQARLEPSA